MRTLDTEITRSRAQASPRHSASEEHDNWVEKLESLSLLSGGVAHDFNNLLMAILGNADLALAVMDEQSVELRDYVEEIQNASQRAADLCRSLLAFSGRGRFSMSIVELKPLIEQAAPALGQDAGETVHFTIDAPDGLPAIKGHPEELRRVLHQLVLNAGEAIDAESGGEIRLRLAAAPPTAPPLAQALGAPLRQSGQYVMIELTDNGRGMDGSTRLKMFDPFFTTRGAGRGLGLASVFGAVRAHLGRIAVDSQPGSGTCVRIYLPALESGPAA